MQAAMQPGVVTADGLLTAVMVATASEAVTPEGVVTAARKG
jgi:hypothetical protein